ncbi:transglycosylase SLT domain-containing protein [Eoetvoesiella caeni]
MKSSKLNRFCLSVLFCYSASASALDLSGTIFEKAGKAVGIDPPLIYSIALAESAYGQGKGRLSPHPWTLRTKTATYADTRIEAEAVLKSYLDSGRKLVDVGLMQINVRWNGHRVGSPLELLDPYTNVLVGAQILAEAIGSSPKDLELGIGRYHNWDDDARARNYGARVLAIYRNVVHLGRNQ